MACNRREFLQKAGRTMVGAAALPLACRCGERAAPSAASEAPQQYPVARLAMPEVLDDAGRISESDAATAIHHALEGCGGLEAMFQPGERVGIKLNCLAGKGLSTQPPLVVALISELGRVGIGAEDIIVFERSERELKDAGFPVGRHRGARFLANDSPGMGYEPQPFLHKSVGSCFSSILTRQVDAFINFGVLKDHNLAGVSAGLKNLFGLIHNPNKYHDANCNPYIAHILEAPWVRGKLRLSLCDGLVAQYQGGPGLMPQYTWRPGILLACRDPVALDAVAAGIVEKKRAAAGLPSLGEDGRRPAFISTAAELGLGEADLEAIRVVEV